MGDWLMTRQLKRHMLSDGSMIEDSLSYHRFVMEMLMVRQLLGDAPYEIQQALQSSALHLVDLGVLNGPVPQYGDWDEGRVLADSGIAGSTVGSLLLALHLVGFEVPRASWPSHDELSWYSAPQYGLKPIPAPTSGSIRAGYFVRCSTDTYTTWLKVSGGPSHQHADLSALWIQHNGEWITEDPGTGTYNGPLEVRNGFRTSIAHNVWCPANEDQLQPHRAFRWLRSAKGICSNPLVISDRHFVLMVHDAYLHANQHLRVARLVVTSPTGVTVFDAADRSVDTEWTMSIPLGQGITKDHFFGIEDAYEVTGSTHPFLGWHSPTYGSWVQSRWLRVHRSTIQSTTWGVGDLDENVFDICFKWETNQVTVNFKTDNGTHEIELSYV